MTSSAPFELRPTLSGTLITVRPLNLDDFEAMYAAASDPLIWGQHTDPERYQREAFESRVYRNNKRSRRATEKLGARFSHIEIKGAGAFARSTAFYRIDADAWQQR